MTSEPCISERVVLAYPVDSKIEAFAVVIDTNSDQETAYTLQQRTFWHGASGFVVSKHTREALLKMFRLKQVPDSWRGTLEFCIVMLDTWTLVVTPTYHIKSYG